MSIISPLPGEAVQGNMLITGNTAIPDFFSYELAFGYTNDTTNTWFLIDQSYTSVNNSVIAEWNTFQITDGIYNLRLVVTRSDGSQETLIVEGIRVRNYSIVETITPIPTITLTPAPTMDPTLVAFLTTTPTAILPPSVTPAPTATMPPPRATPLPPNPAQLTAGEITLGVLRGAGGALVAFLILGIYISFRSKTL